MTYWVWWYIVKRFWFTGRRWCLNIYILYRLISGSSNNEGSKSKSHSKECDENESRWNSLIMSSVEIRWKKWNILGFKKKPHHRSVWTSSHSVLNICKNKIWLHFTFLNCFYFQWMYFLGFPVNEFWMSGLNVNPDSSQWSTKEPIPMW